MLSFRATFSKRERGAQDVERAVNSCALAHPGRRLTLRVGTEASVSTLDDGGARTCLKQFHPATDPNFVRAEYEALGALHDALSRNERLRNLVDAP